MSDTAQPRPNLSRLLAAAKMQLNLQATQRDDVLAELVNGIPALAKDEEARQKLLRALVDREQMHSTGIGDGVALPHARNAIVGLVDEAVLVFGRHVKGVPFGAIDGQPAKLFFLLVAPNVSQHLAILARLSRLLRDSRLRQELLKADRPEKVLQIIDKAEAEN